MKAKAMNQEQFILHADTRAQAPRSYAYVYCSMFTSSNLREYDRAALRLIEANNRIHKHVNEIMNRKFKKRL